MNRRGAFALGLALVIGGAGGAYLYDGALFDPGAGASLLILNPPGVGYTAAGDLYTATGGPVTGTNPTPAMCPDVVGTKVLSLPGAAFARASTPSTTANSITADIDLRARITMADWTPAATAVVIGKRIGASNNGYQLRVTTTGNLELSWSADGTAITFINSLATLTIADGMPLWVRVTMDVDDGAGSKVIAFYTSNDGAAWTQLGGAITNAGTTSIYPATADLEVGAGFGGSNTWAGIFHYAEIRNGIGGTVVAKFDPNTSATVGGSSFVSATGETWTISGTAVISQQTLRSLGVNKLCVSDGTSLRVPSTVANLLPRSEEFDNASWVKTNITVTANSIPGPNGTFTADKVESSTTGALMIQDAVVAATSATCSIFVKKGSSATEANRFVLRNVTTATNLADATLNYDTPSIAGTAGATVAAIGGGWLRVVIPVTTGITSGDTIRCYNFFTGGGGAGHFAYGFGAQLVAGGQAGDYCPTTASSATCVGSIATVATPAAWLATPSVGSISLRYCPAFSGLTPGTNRVLIDTREGAGNDGAVFFIGPTGGVALDIRGAGNIASASSGVISWTAGTCYSLAARWTAGGCPFVSVNGTEFSAGCSAIAAPTTHGALVYVGRRFTASTWADGNIDLVRLGR